VRSFLECHDTLLMFLVVCEKIYVSRSKCWCSTGISYESYLQWKQNNFFNNSKTV